MDYRKDLTIKAACERYFEKIVEACTDIAFLVARHNNLELPEDEDYSTLNGYLVARLDKIPKVNDRLQIEKGMFRVISATKRRVLKVEFTIKQETMSEN